MWRIASCRDYWAKYELDAHVSLTANMHDAFELALAQAEMLAEHPLIDDCQIDEETGELLPVVTIVTDNGGSFRSATFELFIMRHPELRHVRTRVRPPGQNGSPERGFGTMKYEWPFREEIDDGLALVDQSTAYPQDYTHVRPHEAISWSQPRSRSTSAWPTPPTPTSTDKKSCQLLDVGQIHGGYGYSNELDVEGYFRDAPLMIVGEGTNEIQRRVIVRQLLKRCT